MWLTHTCDGHDPSTLWCTSSPIERLSTSSFLFQNSIVRERFCLIQNTSSSASTPVTSYKYVIANVAISNASGCGSLTFYSGTSATGSEKRKLLWRYLRQNRVIASSGLTRRPEHGSSYSLGHQYYARASILYPQEHRHHRRCCTHLNLVLNGFVANGPGAGSRHHATSCQRREPSFRGEFPHPSTSITSHSR